MTAGSTPPSDAAPEAFAALKRLLRRSELAEVSGKAFSGIGWDESRLPAAALDPCRRLLEQAGASGAVRLVRLSGYRSEIVGRILLGDADALARFVGVERWAGRLPAMEAGIAASLDGAPEWLASIAGRCVARWARDGQAFGLGPGDVEAASETFRLLRALADGPARNVDPRTFSLEATGRTKALEERRGPVVATLRAAFSFPEGISAEEILAAFGLLRFGQPLLLRAPLLLPGMSGPVTMRPYVGIAPEMIDAVAAGGRAPYLLIIENLTTFNRYVREVDDDGLVLYAGGFPNRLCREAARRLASGANHAFHWGDIDPGGVRIFALLEQAVDGLRPHLMDAELARLHGAVAAGDPTLSKLAASGSAVAAVAAFLCAEETWRLEQEALVPRPPL